ncbi:MAG: hypothetical protein JWO33_1076 [Caulobacteraceae bacterium]|nr:hypothetical protein [Caulobacteraceae bacterium]
MSDLIERYVMAVSANLPKKERADITAELTDILFSKVEAKEAELGRPLTKAEEEVLLRAFGHPLEVAGRYGKTQQLIGPAAYPFYVFFLKAVMGIMVAIYIALWAIALIAGERAVHVDADIVEALIFAFAGVTLTFVVIERTGAIDKMARNWKPGQLPMLGAASGRPPFEVLFEIAMVVAVTLWWTGVIHLPDPVPRHMSLGLAPVFTNLFWPILALLIAQGVLDVYELIMPGRVRAHAWGRIAFHVALMVVMLVMWQAGHWIDVTMTGVPAERVERVQAAFDRGFLIGLGFGFICAAYEIWRAARRLTRMGRLRTPKLA